MAQIKKIVKPGDLIRGAKVGVAGLDKDGNVIGTGIDTEDIAVFPDGAQSGDVLAWGGETGPEWRPHYPESGSAGDVLTLGETGPEWTPPSGGGSYYSHNITINGNCFIYLITSDPTPFTAATLNEYLTSKYSTGYTPHDLPMFGYITKSSYPGEYLPIIKAEYYEVFGQIQFYIRAVCVNYDTSANTVKLAQTTLEWKLTSSDTLNDRVIEL